MNRTSLTDDLKCEPPDELDRLLSSYFQAQMRTPWPTAPEVSLSEPASLVAARATRLPTGMPQSSPVTPGVLTDSGRRARATLAVSIAMLFGTCWYLSSGIEPANPTAPLNRNASPGLNINLNQGTADGKNGLPALIDQSRKSKLEQPVPPRVDLNKLD